MRNLQITEHHNHFPTGTLSSGSASCEDPLVTKIPFETRNTVWKRGCELLVVLVMGFHITNVFWLQVCQLPKIGGDWGPSSNGAPEETGTFHRKTPDAGKKQQKDLGTYTLAHTQVPRKISSFLSNVKKSFLPNTNEFTN